MTIRLADGFVEHNCGGGFIGRDYVWRKLLYGLYLGGTLTLRYTYDSWYSPNPKP